jgi:hypothetical protein
LYLVVPKERFAFFAARHGGVDPRSADAIAIAQYAKSTLVLARTHLDPERVEKAFTDRAIRVGGRAIDLRAGPETTIVRTWGEVGSSKETIVLFGRRGAGFEMDGDTHVRAAELFATGRLKRASPAFKAPPLDHASSVMGKAPLRLFFSGPFSEDGMGGLLRIASAASVLAYPVGSNVRVRAAIFGIEEKEARAASARVSATFDKLAASGLGRLCGLDKPRKGPETSQTDDAIILEVELDAMTLGKGLHDATEASVVEVLKL